jgi:Rha family phage regulatory protein
MALGQSGSMRFSKPAMEHAMTQSLGASAPILVVVDGIPTTTSLDVARVFTKRHDIVLRSVENLRQQVPHERLHNFAETSTVINMPNGGTREERAYRLTRDGFTLLAMGFTGKKALTFKLAYIDAFNRMEAALRHPLDAERQSRALAMASEVATVAFRTAFDAMMSGDDLTKFDRWMVCLEYNSGEYFIWDYMATQSHVKSIGYTIPIIPF